MRRSAISSARIARARRRKRSRACARCCRHGHHAHRQRHGPRSHRHSRRDGLPAERALGRRLAGKGADPGRREGLRRDGGGRGLARGAHREAAQARELRGDAARAPRGGRDAASARRRQPLRAEPAAAVDRGQRSHAAAGRSGFPSSSSARTTRCPLPPGSGCFQANTNGLASGNHPLEAISHGLCEVVERDATTLWKLQSARSREQRAIDPRDRRPIRTAGRCSTGFAAADLDVRIWDTTSDVGIASFVCLVTEADGEYADPEFGSGCHPARQVALLRALTEAAQARNTYISGARDDYPADAWEGAVPPPPPRRSAARDSTRRRRPPRRSHSVPTFERAVARRRPALAAGAAPRGGDRAGDRGGSEQGSDRRPGDARRGAGARRSEWRTRQATTRPGRVRGG